MLNKKYRFHSRGGVKYVYKHGKTVRTPLVSLIYGDNKRGFTRVAVVVSKKVDKSAVVRNRVRRRVYEALRVNFEKIPKERDYIFVVYSSKVLGMDFEKLQEVLGELVGQSRVA